MTVQQGVWEGFGLVGLNFLARTRPLALGIQALSHGSRSNLRCQEKGDLMAPGGLAAVDTALDDGDWDLLGKYEGPAWCHPKDLEMVVGGCNVLKIRSIPFRFEIRRAA